MNPGESKTAEFTLTPDELGFYGRDLVKRVESGDFNVWIGGDSKASLKASFVVE